MILVFVFNPFSILPLKSGEGCLLYFACRQKGVFLDSANRGSLSFINFSDLIRSKERWNNIKKYDN